MITAVLFDLDGTLADTALDLARALNVVLERNGLPLVCSQALKSIAGDGALAMVRFACPDADEIQQQMLVQAFLTEYEANPCVDTVLFDQVKEVITALVENNMVWGIVTNKHSRFSHQVISKLPFPYPPAVVVSGDTLAQSKPDPAPLLYAAKAINQRAENCCYVGDGLRDIQAAKAANMMSVAVHWGYVTKATDIQSWQADANISSMQQLLAVLKV